METTVEASPGLTVGDLDTALSAIDHVGRPDFRLLIDTMHVVRSGSGADAVAAARPEPDRLRAAQRRDARTAIDSYMEEAMYERMVPGEGELPLRELLAVLPDGLVISLEVPQRSLAEAGVGPEERLGRCVEATRALLAEVRDASPPGSGRPGPAGHRATRCDPCHRSRPSPPARKPRRPARTYMHHGRAGGEGMRAAPERTKGLCPFSTSDTQRRCGRLFDGAALQRRVVVRPIRHRGGPRHCRIPAGRQSRGRRRDTRGSPKSGERWLGSERPTCSTTGRPESRSGPSKTVGNAAASRPGLLPDLVEEARVRRARRSWATALGERMPTIRRLAQGVGGSIRVGRRAAGSWRSPPNCPHRVPASVVRTRPDP